MGKKIIHVIGTGTIGEPLIGLFVDFREKFEIDEVTFHKRTPLKGDRAKIEHLIGRGAKLAVDEDKVKDFESLGHKVSFTADEAIERATVVIDCTPAGNKNKEEFYLKADGPKGFIAQGSEFGFGKPYVRGVNDKALVPGEDRFIQVVSCNTHNIVTLIKTICEDDDGYILDKGVFVCMRRSNDVTQTSKFVPAPMVGTHDDETYGTHHARDAQYLFETLNIKLNLFSSAIKINTQYMHSLWFNFLISRSMSKEELVDRLLANPRVAVTEKRYANLIFSFGRDHGYYGRILSQTVVVLPTLAVRNGNEIYGFCFTPQDGNSLLSSIAATLWFIDPDPEYVDKRLNPIRRWIYREI